MNISYLWLRSIAPGITADPREISDRLGMLGAPVDDLVPLSEGLGDVVIARVEEVRPHPNADRLRLCTVSAGAAPLQVVCGAPNVEAGGYYPFAPVGAALPGGISIGKAKLRGEVSEGMLCSARELGLGRDHEGIMTLAGEWAPGSSFVDALGLDDWRLEVDVTPNRPDLLSHLGVARELAPGGLRDIRFEPLGDGRCEPAIETAEREGVAGGARVSIEDPAGCPRYMAAVIRGVRVAPSPEWLASRLRAVGLRPINNIVDATNYVLHEMGQPLHAFDLGRLDGPEIRVRPARAGETLRTLDGVERKLDADTLVIADAGRPVAIAGVMGGEESEVSDETTDVLLECALFDERSVRRTARALGLATDASYRFERGVDPELQPAALARVVDLVLAVAGGALDGAMLDVSRAEATRRVVELRPERAASVLGIGMAADEIASLLEPIGFATEPAGDRLSVTVPGFRPDVAREIDLIEEIARRRGYDSFPEERVAFRASIVPEDPLLAIERGIRGILTRWGLLEARTVAFAPASDDRVPLLNPLSAEESHLRDRLAPGLLRRVEHNWAHGVRNVRLYEVGTAFLPAEDGGQPREEVRVAAVLTGARRPPHWKGEPEPWDVWDLKALLSEMAEAVGAAAPVPAGDTLELHDRSGARVAAGWRVPDSDIDAPAWADAVWALELTLPTAAAEVDSQVGYRPLPEYPPAERDLALLVPTGTSADEVERVISTAAGDTLAEMWPFDLYAGEGIESGARSIAWRLRFRRPDRTLTDAEVDRGVSSILGALEDRLGVRRR